MLNNRNKKALRILFLLNCISFKLKYYGNNEVINDSLMLAAILKWL
jgi:hypothetical protein